MLCAEAWVLPLSKMAWYVREDEMNQAFNFGYLATPWDATALRKVIAESMEAFGGVGAPSTWVLSNHDVVRHASRFGLTMATEGEPTGLGPGSPEKPDEVLGLQVARAATTVLMALPGSAYIYQGEELGLPEVIDIPDELRQDPTFFRTNGERYGRDGCRVPIPWEGNAPAYGFNASGASWLPQPASFAALARSEQEGVAGSTLELYKTLVRLRSEMGLGTGGCEWLEGYGDDVVAFRNGPMGVIANIGEHDIALPAGEVLVSSGELTDALLPPHTTAWVKLAS
jgi:alpha-glucosidase